MAALYNAIKQTKSNKWSLCPVHKIAQGVGASANLCRQADLKDNRATPAATYLSAWPHYQRLPLSRYQQEDQGNPLAYARPTTTTSQSGDKLGRPRGPTTSQKLDPYHFLKSYGSYGQAWWPSAFRGPGISTTSCIPTNMGLFRP